MMKMAALMEILPRGIQDHIMMHMDEIEEDYDVMREKVMRYTINKVEQSRRGGGGGASEMQVDQVHYSGDDGWGGDDRTDDVDAVYGKGGYKTGGAKGKGKGKGGGERKLL